MILDQVQQVLSSGKQMAIPEIAGRVPELAGREEGPEILRLLLRLDRRFERSGDRWYAISTDDAAGRIVDAARAYFRTHGSRGQLLVHLSRAVAEQTGQDIEHVRATILDRFVSTQGGKLILNQEKR